MQSRKCWTKFRFINTLKKVIVFTVNEYEYICMASVKIVGLATLLPTIGDSIRNVGKLNWYIQGRNLVTTFRGYGLKCQTNRAWCQYCPTNSQGPRKLFKRGLYGYQFLASRLNYII